MIVAPTEPDLLKSLGEVNMAPETFGVDFLWSANKQLFGAQRKEFKDFLASLGGDRLARESQQAKRLSFRVLIIEGRPLWTREGELLDRFSNFTKTQYRGALLSLQSLGWEILFTDSTEETLATLIDVEAWTRKVEHNSLFQRPKNKNGWGDRDDEFTQMWVLQSVDGIGPKQAKAILKHFKGLPISWTIQFADLLEVPGVGKVTAEKLWRAFPVKEGDNGSSHQVDAKRARQAEISTASETTSVSKAGRKTR